MRLAGSLRRLVGLAPLAAALLVGGCYEAKVELIDKGETAAIAGTYACRLLRDDQESFELTIAKAGEGAFHFTTTDLSGALKLRKLDNGLHLLQTSDDEKPGTFYYAYGEATADGGLRASYPDREDRALSQQAIDRYAVRFFDILDREDLTGARLEGAPENLARFLADPAAHRLLPWFACTPR
jgi:hypothetical protein